MRTESGKTRVQPHAPFYRLFRTGQILFRKCATRLYVEMNENSISGNSLWCMSLVACLQKHVYVDVNNWFDPM